ncbi:MAG: HesA/MoeB/ThiF family protein [Geobacter sp.]|nr:HesA/MoeB/ThiF family protein [Geobacter sp.]
MEPLLDYLLAGADGDLVPWRVQQAAMEKYGCSCAQVEEAILSNGLLPARYQRNRQAITTAGQLTLFRSRVAVIGCGGLGGYIIEQLARLGIGQLVVIDPDVFEEHNLNRQLLSSMADLGRAKVEAAVVRVGAINPAVTVSPLEMSFNAANGRELLQGVDVVIDGLDSISVRLELADVCTALAMPLVHGAIGGWYGQVATQFPGEMTIENSYANWVEGKGVEQQLGNPAFTPAVVASLQVAEACKVLLREGQTLRCRKLLIDLLAMEIHEIGM